jgi:hypothetical protein
MHVTAPASISIEACRIYWTCLTSRLFIEQILAKSALLFLTLFLKNRRFIRGV